MSRASARSRMKLLLVLALVALVAAGCGERRTLPQNVLDPEGPEARTLDRLWDLTFPFAVAVFFLVQGLVVYMMWRFRARSDEDAPVQVHGNAKAELGWTIAPALLLAVIGVFTVVTVFDIDRRAEEWDVPPTELRLWVLIQQLACHRTLKIPHVGRRLEALLIDFAGAFRPDTQALEGRLGDLGSLGDLTNPGALGG
ncbi:MAG: hypothetical protein KY439_08540, partial [Actinobacteria bacterium]|nr:hypothetical protein [Actinomycetota bacterium]